MTSIEAAAIPFEQKEKSVFDFFTETVREASVVFSKNDESIELIPLRIQMIISFCLADIFASYWYEYQAKTGTPKSRFCSWYDAFCRVPQNEEYSSKSLWTALSGDRLHHLRNSLVHFFGLSEEKEGIYLSLASNDLPESERTSLEKKFLDSGKRNFIIRPADFNLLIRKAGKLMLEGWSAVVQEANSGDQLKRSEHIEGIERIWLKVQLEGAMQIIKSK